MADEGNTDSQPEQAIGPENIAMSFGTPLSTKLWEDTEELNAELRDQILGVEASFGGVQKSNVGGWHSESDLLHWEGNAVATLRDRIMRTALDMTRHTVTSENLKSVTFRADAWANVSRRGNYNSVHDHPNAMWSGVYYVSVGEMDGDNPHNGKLEFVDPRVGINMLNIEGGIFNARYVIDPIPGLMVFFPSWLKHLVHPFQGEGERISISWNVYVRTNAENITNS